MKTFSKRAPARRAGGGRRLKAAADDRGGRGGGAPAGKGADRLWSGRGAGAVEAEGRDLPGELRQQTHLASEVGCEDGGHHLAEHHLIDGIRVEGFTSALFAAAVLGVLNTFFRPLLVVLTLPINILTFGLFLLVINALMLKMASGLIGGFHVQGFGAAVLGSIVISVANWLLSAALDSRPRQDVIDLRRTDKDRWE